MKKQNLSQTYLGISLVAAVIFTAGVLVMNGCKKDDTTPPTITLTGGAVSQNITSTYAEPGFSAKDDKDGDITSKVTVSGVTNGLVGIYTIKYNVSDAAGNAAAEQTRSLTVKSDQLAGLYNVSDVVTGKYAGTYTYNATVTQSSTAYNKINIANFGGLGTAVIVSATVSGSTITIASQQPSGMQDPGTVVGSGTVSGINITSLTYSITYTSGGADNGNATYTNHQ